MFESIEKLYLFFPLKQSLPHKKRSNYTKVDFSGLRVDLRVAVVCGVAGVNSLALRLSAMRDIGSESQSQNGGGRARELERESQGREPERESRSERARAREPERESRSGRAGAREPEQRAGAKSQSERARAESQSAAGRPSREVKPGTDPIRGPQDTRSRQRSQHTY